jgi:hypothetical protein
LSLDHHEDGYEFDATKPTQATTEIWGDGNAANGCAPNVSPCTNANDIIKSGTAIVIQNNVFVNPPPGTAKHQTVDATTVQRSGARTSKFYDGGDRVQSNFPIAMTRAAYPSNPGSVMAGAVEVLDTSSWGTSYVTPIGQNVLYQTNAFEYVSAYVMVRILVWMNLFVSPMHDLTIVVLHLHRLNLTALKFD